MSALIVGGDRVAPYRDYLLQQGYEVVHHWNGRRQSECHRRIPVDTRLVVVLVDQINHGLARKVRRSADDMGVAVVFTRCSVCHLHAELLGQGGCAGCSSAL